MKLIKNLFLMTYFLIPSLAFARINVVTTTEDLAAITRAIGGDHVNVSAIAKGYQDPHFVDAKPSYLLKLKKADLFIQVGLELEVGWAPSLLVNSRNNKILPGESGFLDVSKGVKILEKPSGSMDRSQGDTHPFGNPHYWLNPTNGFVIARSISEKLIQLEPSEKASLQKNLEEFESELTQKIKAWQELKKPIEGISILAYHNTWSYFDEFIGLKVDNYIEPRPGIPPAPAHVKQVIESGKIKRIRIIVVEPYFDHKLPMRIADEMGARLIELAPSVGASHEIKTYFDLFDQNIKRLIEGVK